MVTVQNMQSKLEVWKNTAAGIRWFQSYDLQGRPTSKTVPGGKTFTITAFERQINQEAVADAKEDMFRNGTFVIVKAAEDTNVDEFASPEALTDEEIEVGVRAVLYEDGDIESWLQNVSSPITLQRVLEQLVIEDAGRDHIDHVKEKISEVQPPTPERVVVSTADNTTTSESDPKGR